MTNCASLSAFVSLMITFSFLGITCSQAQSCPPIPGMGGVSAFVNHYRQDGSNDEKLKILMRSETAERLDAAKQSLVALIDKDPRCGFFRWRPDENTNLELHGPHCFSVRQALICHQELGWPLSRNPRIATKQDAAPKPKTSATGKEILSTELDRTAVKTTDDAALDRIDLEEEALKCGQNLSNPQCRDLERRRSNILNGKDEMHDVASKTTPPVPAKSNAFRPTDGNSGCEGQTYKSRITCVYKDISSGGNSLYCTNSNLIPIGVEICDQSNSCTFHTVPAGVTMEKAVQSNPTRIFKKRTTGRLQCPA